VSAAAPVRAREKRENVYIYVCACVSLLFSFLGIICFIIITPLIKNTYIHTHTHLTQIAARLPLINTLFGSSEGKNSVTDIYNAIKTHLDEQKHKQEENEWLHTALQALETECPASHVITLHAIRTAQSFLVGAGAAAAAATPPTISSSQNGGKEKEGWDIDQGLGIEYIANCGLGFRDDFIEGVSTAVGARKGETPAWTHKSSEEAEADPEIVQLKEKMAEGKSFWELI
jgi:hypothetical protein